MRLFSVLIAAMAATIPAVAQADVPHRSREPDAAYRGVRQGDILPLSVIRDRVRIPGATFIGADLIGGTRYRLRFMRGMDVIFVDVDARTGRVLWTSAG
jgi:hypothetical protein